MREFILKFNENYIGTIWAEELQIKQYGDDKFLNLKTNEEVVFSRLMNDNIEIIEENKSTIISINK